MAVRSLKLGKAVPEPTAGSRCLVAGWGRTDFKSNKMSDVLMSVNVTVVDRVKCNSPAYYNLKPVITTSMICAGTDGKNSADTCQVRQPGSSFLPPCQRMWLPVNDLHVLVLSGTIQGDSGGPLLCNGVLTGVTSFGVKCGLKKSPACTPFSLQNNTTGSRRWWQRLKYHESSFCAVVLLLCSIYFIQQAQMKGETQTLQLWWDDLAALVRWMDISGSEWLFHLF